MSYTKGEWVVVEGDTCFIVTDEKGNTLFLTPYYSEIDEANAHLIAKSPRMYEALRELIRRDEYGSIRLPTQASDIIKEALI